LFHGLELLVYMADINCFVTFNIAVSQVFSDLFHFLPDTTDEVVIGRSKVVAVGGNKKPWLIAPVTAKHAPKIIIRYVQGGITTSL